MRRLNSAQSIKATDEGVPASVELALLNSLSQSIIAIDIDWQINSLSL